MWAPAPGSCPSLLPRWAILQMCDHMPINTSWLVAGCCCRSIVVTRGDSSHGAGGRGKGVRGGGFGHGDARCTACARQSRQACSGARRVAGVAGADWVPVHVPRCQSCTCRLLCLLEENASSGVRGAQGLGSGCRWSKAAWRSWPSTPPWTFSSANPCEKSGPLGALYDLSGFASVLKHHITCSCVLCPQLVNHLTDSIVRTAGRLASAFQSVIGSCG